MSGVFRHEAVFAERAARVRRARHLSQQQLGEAVGLPRSAIVDIELGRRRINLDEAFAIAAALQVQLADLVGSGPLVIETVLE